MKMRRELLFLFCLSFCVTTEICFGSTKTGKRKRISRREKNQEK